MKTRTTRRHTREEWIQIVADFQGSGQDKAAFCRARSIQPDRLQYWLRYWDGASDTHASSTTPAFVEMPLPQRQGGWDIELELGEGMRLRLRRT